MATDTRSISTSIPDDATFRATGTAIAAALVACGMVKTADTGQIDLTTVAKPAGAGVAAGYEIYRFSDSLQATKPIFFKIEYGTANVATTFGLWLTVGTGTNGAGTITGQASTRRQMYGTTALTGGTLYTSGDGSRIAFLGPVNTASPSVNNTIWWAIDRTRDASGAATGDGYSWFSGWSSGTYQWACVPMIGAVTGASNSAPGLDPAAGGVSNLGADVALVIPTTFLGKAFYSLTHLYGRGADLGSGSFSATVLGASHTFLATGTATTNAGISGVVAAVGVAMIWE